MSSCRIESKQEQDYHCELQQRTKEINWEFSLNLQNMSSKNSSLLKASLVEIKMLVISN